MKTVFALAFLIPLAAHAAPFECTTKVSSLSSKAELAAMAKVGENAAMNAAIEAVRAPGATVSKGGLAVENGCLVYAYGVQVPGNDPPRIVIVDAGDGKVLMTGMQASAT